MSKDSNTWLILGAVAIALYYWNQSSNVIQISTTSAPTPLSIYPEYAHVAHTSMAATPYQKAPAAAITPIPLYTAVQSQEQGAVLGQCVGSYPGCTVLMSDTQLGL